MQGSTENSRARRRSFLHPDNSARTWRRLSYRRHTQRRHAMRLSSCSAAIDACRTPTALPAQVSIASSCPAHPLPAASAARLAPPAPEAGGSLPSARASRHQRRPPAPCALNCVTAAHRRSRSPPPLVAAPHQRCRPGLPLPLAAALLLTFCPPPPLPPSLARRYQCVSSFITLIAENYLLYPASNQEAERADGWRASGRCSGAGRCKDLCRRTDGRLLNRFRAAQRRNWYVYNCLAELRVS